ncbi:MAG: class I SAM-dependent methyltransferase, partial [Pseudomonadota bacterium]|nr:class I SAM-dependent methyltransferase [Pseudomonadota bacterium]
MTQVTTSIPTASVQHMARLIAQMPISGLRLLDAGCGAGDFLRLALEEGADAHGFEVSETALARATSAGIDPARLKVASGTTLPYGEARFDIGGVGFSVHD